MLQVFSVYFWDLEFLGFSFCLSKMDEKSNLKGLKGLGGFQGLKNSRTWSKTENWKPLPIYK